MADVVKFTTNRKSSGGGMQGGTRNCPGFLCKQKSVSRNLPPVANRARSNGEALVAGTAKSIMPLLRAAFPGFTFTIFMFFMVKCICSFSCFFVVKKLYFSVFSVTSVVK